MSKTKTVLAAGGAISAILVIIAGVFAYMAFGEASDTNKKVAADLGKLKNLYAKPLFPNGENIKTEKENGDEYALRLEVLSGIVARGAIPLDASHSSGGFVNELNDKIVPALVAAAPKNSNSQSIIPANFYFGFERYDRLRGDQP
ncbi:MAG: Amuc_1100 family pilus-like protein, partial [Kiritimatiellaeota bacterium]|nr:Amuc_1100 family pilus-like protein [Kiritimatiellota bacterium]